MDSDGSQGSERFRHPVLSADGTCVAFTSTKRNFRSDHLGLGSALFVHELSTGKTERWKYELDGVPMSMGLSSPTLSEDGSIIATYVVPDLVTLSKQPLDIAIIDRRTGVIRRVDPAKRGVEAPLGPFPIALAADASSLVFPTMVVFENGLNRGRCYLFDLATEKAVRLPFGAESMLSMWPSISANGQTIAFGHSPGEQGDPHPTEIYVLDRQAESVTPLPSDPSTSAWASMPKLSAEGRMLVFSSHARPVNLRRRTHRRDLFVLDREAGTTQRVTIGLDGGWPNGSSYQDGTVANVMSADGRFVVFSSMASDLVPGDTNERSDVFVRDLIQRRTVRVSVASDGTQANSHSGYGTISSDGSRVAFESAASNLVEGDTKRGAGHLCARAGVG